MVGLTLPPGTVIRLGSPYPLRGGVVIVCHCRVVSDRDVRIVAERGARTTGEACRATGAGSGCGTCVFSVKAILDEHVARERSLPEAILQTLTEVDGAAS